MSLELVSDSVAVTRDIGRRLGAACQAGAVVALVGELGAGKTQLVKGLGAGLAVPDAEHISSPTFILAAEYPGRLRLFHVDAYRLTGAEETETIGLAEMLAADGAVAVEWADRIADALPEDRLTVAMASTGATARRLALDAGGPRSAALLDRFAVAG